MPGGPETIAVAMQEGDGRREGGIMIDDVG